MPYFDWSEDLDDDDAALILIFIKCRLCSHVQEHYVNESRANFIYNWAGKDNSFRHGAENFVYNSDNTYTSFSSEVVCSECYLTWSYSLERIWSNQVDEVIREYQNVNPQFDSPLEVYFWTSWKEKCPIALSPQYQCGVYRIDFVHTSTKTAIELDGGKFHSTPYQIAHDKRRQTELEQQGWRFLRFRGEEVFSDIDNCIVEILHFLSKAN